MDDLEKTLKIAGIEAEIIDYDDEFQFNCQQCGLCCMDREDIILNAFDIYQASKALNITPLKFVDEYCNTIIGENSHLQVICLDCKNKFNGHCGLLDFDIATMQYKCRIHDCSPCACKSHPIGTTYAMNAETGEKFTRYILVKSCGNSKAGPKHKVSDWMSYQKQHEEEISLAHEIPLMFSQIMDFEKTQSLSSAFIIEAFVNGSKSYMEGMMLKDCYNTLIQSMSYCYLNYDTNISFVEQIKKNIDSVKPHLNKIKEVVSDMFKDCCEIFDIKESEIEDFSKNTIITFMHKYCKKNNCTQTEFAKRSIEFERKIAKEMHLEYLENF